MRAASSELSMLSENAAFTGSSMISPSSVSSETRLQATIDRRVKVPSIRVETETKVKLGVLLLNLGGPENQKDVEGFLYNLFADPDIIRLPPLLSVLQKPIAYIVAKRRAPKSRAAYQSIGGGSPIVRYTSEQATLIERELKRKGVDAKAYFAMRYWHPFTEDTLAHMKADGVNAMVVIPLYPQYSISTSGSSLRLLQEIFYKNPETWGPGKMVHTVVPAWYYRKGYVRAMAQLVLAEIAQYSEDEAKQGIHVLFSAHGVPKSYIDAGDPYKRQIEECVKLISNEISVILMDPSRRPPQIPEASAISLASGPDALHFHLSFQSRVGPVQWLKPYTEDTLEKLGQEGVKNLVVVPGNNHKRYKTIG